MVVKIELLGIQREIADTSTLSMVINGNTVLRDALEYVGSKFPALAFSEDSVLVAVNGKVVPLESVLKANDVISIVPHIGGG
jgi:molybdopterin converting factor small subunit